jgi:hypothetical protein
VAEEDGAMGQKGGPDDVNWVRVRVDDGGGGSQLPLDTVFASPGTVVS